MAAVQKRVVIQKRMRFSIVSCSYTAQCLGASYMKPTQPSQCAQYLRANVRLGIAEPVPGLFDPVSPVGDILWDYLVWDSPTRFCLPEKVIQLP